MIEMLSLLLIGCACPYAYGVMIGKKGRAGSSSAP